MAVDTKAEGQGNFSQSDLEEQYDLYSEFSDNFAAYVELIGNLVEASGLVTKKRIVDLGCGSGLSTNELVRRIEDPSGVVIYAVDISEYALKQARERLKEYKDFDIRYVQGDATNFMDKIDVDAVDGILYCNSIHYVPDKEKLMRMLNDSLAQGGVLAFNSSFISDRHHEAYKVFVPIILNARRILKREHNMKPDGEIVVESRKRLSSAEYLELLRNVGFNVRFNELVYTPVSNYALHKFVAFKDFAEGVMPGTPWRLAGKVLQQAVTKTKKTLPRYFAQFAVQKA